MNTNKEDNKILLIILVLVNKAVANTRAEIINYQPSSLYLVYKHNQNKNRR